jgi:hypothetical protein
MDNMGRVQCGGVVPLIRPSTATTASGAVSRAQRGLTGPSEIDAR